MQGSTTLFARVAHRARPLTIAVASFALVLCAQACGSKKTDPSSITPGTTNTTTDPGSVANTNATTSTTANCAPSNRSTLSQQSNSLIYTPAGGGTAVAMPYVLFTGSSAPSDTNKTWEIAAFDYDYCAFSADFNYSVWPLTAWHAFGGYLVDGTPGAALSAGTTYTLGHTSPYLYSGGSGLTVSSSASPAGTECTALSYPDLTGTNMSNTTPPSGAISITTGTLTTANTANITGTIDLKFGDGSTLSGPFVTGACSSISGPRPTTLSAPAACGCTLSPNTVIN